VLEKKSSEMEKPLDELHKVWYNNNVGRKRIAYRKNPAERTDPPQSRDKRCSDGNEKNFQKPLTLDHESDRMNMKRGEGKPHKPERETP
jgi:hypothetical protein